MEKSEGVIKYHLNHQYGNLPSELDIVELNAWRTLFYRLQLIGRIPERYAGLGFGNISCRVVPLASEFLISGTQTGHIPNLARQHYALIQAASPKDNSILSYGLCPPSSEALTHAGVYQQNVNIQAVIHVHCPELWRNTRQLQLPHTAENIAYGTPAMVEAVAALFTAGQLDVKPIFSMLGHEDGIVAFGLSLAKAGTVLITELAKAIAFEQRS